MTPSQQAAQQEYNKIKKYWCTYWLTHDPKDWKGDKLNWHHDQAASFWPDDAKSWGDPKYCKKAAVMAKSDKIMKHRDGPNNLFLVPYPVHYDLHELYPKFTEGTAHYKMLNALLLFKDGNGLVLTEEQYDANCKASGKALSYRLRGIGGGNPKLKGTFSTVLSECRRKISNSEVCNLPTEHWRAYNSKNILLRTGISYNTSINFFGTPNAPFSNPEERKSRHDLGISIRQKFSRNYAGATIIYEPWFKKFGPIPNDRLDRQKLLIYLTEDQAGVNDKNTGQRITIVTYDIRKEALDAREICKKVEKPKYQGRGGWWKRPHNNHRREAYEYHNHRIRGLTSE